MKTRSQITQYIMRRAVLAMVMAVVLVALAGSGWGQQAAAASADEKSMTVGSSEVMDFQGIKRAAVSDPAVADYVVLSAKQVMLSAKSAGATDFRVWDEKGQHDFRVIVVAPPSRMPEVVGKIRDTIAQPGIMVSEHNGVIMLEGEVDSPYAAQRAEAIAKAYAPKVDNLLQVRPPAAPEAAPAVGAGALEDALGPNIKVRQLTEKTLQVEGTATPEQKARMDKILNALPDDVVVIDMVAAPGSTPRQLVVHVKVAEVDTTALSKIGVDWGGLTKDSEGLYTPHEQPILFGEVFGGRQPTLSADDGGPIRRLDGISALLIALVTDNKARILAEPNLLVKEGKAAQMLVGGEIPIPVVQAIPIGAGAGAPSVTVQWKEFGVVLQVLGYISADGKSVDLTVTPEVSQLDFANGVVVSGFTIPALRTRRAQSVVHIGDGETLVIGGLYQSEDSKVVRKIPWLSDIPIIGEFFKRTEKQTRQTELMIFVTPEIVTAASAAARTESALKQMGEK